MEINDSGNIVSSYIRGIDLIKNSKDNYYVYNGHGDVTQITNSTGAVVNNYDYDAFDNQLKDTTGNTNP